MSADSRRDVYIDAFSPCDAVEINPDVAHGIAIVGEAQAGKTTVRDILTDVWCDFDPKAEVLSFSNSNGFRGITRDTLDYAGVDPENERLSKPEFLEYFRKFQDGMGADLPNRLLSYYTHKRSDDELRTPAVNSTVAFASEDTTIRPLVTQAGTTFLKCVVNNPDTRPGLVVLDGRSAVESKYKFRGAGVRSIGTLVLGCPPEVVAARKYALPAERVKETARLRERNSIDRARSPETRMTLPEDFARRKRYDAADILVYGERRTLPPLRTARRLGRRLLGRPQPTAGDSLVEAGIQAAIDDEIALVLSTDRISIDTERIVLSLVVRGMLTGVAETGQSRQSKHSLGSAR